MGKKIDTEGLKFFKTTENAMIASKPESTNTATYAHAVGEYFYWKGVLQEVTAAIAVGGTIQTNTNVKPAVLADNVSFLKESIYNEITSNPNPSKWEIGTVNRTTGANTNATNRLRQKTFPVENIYDHVTVPYGYKLSIYGFLSNSDSYIGVWNGTEFQTTETIFLEGDVNLEKCKNAGALYIRFVYGKNDNSDFTNTNDIALLAFTKYESKIEVLENSVNNINEETNNINGVLGKITNIANPNNLILGSVWSSVNNSYPSQGYCRQEIIVKPNTKYTISQKRANWSWFTNDNNENLGNISGNVFTTPLGCTKIRITNSGSENFVLLEGEHSTPIVYDDYPYNEPTYSTLNNITSRLSSIEDNRKYDSYTDISVFSSIGAIGDSYTSGGLYQIDSVARGAHYNVSWPQILARKCGFSAYNYSKPDMDVSAWLTDTERGLTKLIADEAKELYIITLGINTEKLLSNPSENAPIGAISDIDTTNPENNGDTFYGHYGRMLSSIISKAPNAKIILVRPLLTTQEKLNAITAIAELFNIPFFTMANDEYYSSDFYTDNLSNSHPIAVTYAGMALAYERQIKDCIINNMDYFKTIS